MENNKLKMLVGDDQISVYRSVPNINFIDDYGRYAELEFTDNPDEFIEMATTGDYDALLIDLNWETADHTRANKTGYRVLEAVRKSAPIRILHTSKSDEIVVARAKECGATHFLPKGSMPKELEEILHGGNE